MRLKATNSTKDNIEKENMATAVTLAVIVVVAVNIVGRYMNLRELESQPTNITGYDLNA